MVVCIERSAQIFLIFPEWMKFHVKCFTFIHIICTASEDCKAALLWGDSCVQTQRDLTSAGATIQCNKCRPTKTKLQIRQEYNKTVRVRTQQNILRIDGTSFSILRCWQEMYLHNCEAKRAPRQIAQIFPSTNTHSCQEQNILHCDILWVDVKISLLLHSYFKTLIIIEQILNGQTSSSFASE